MTRRNEILSHNFIAFHNSILAFFPNNILPVNLFHFFGGAVANRGVPNSWISYAVVSTLLASISEMTE
jgi:hypothetical protein